MQTRKKKKVTIEDGYLVNINIEEEKKEAWKQTPEVRKCPAKEQRKKLNLNKQGSVLQILKEKMQKEENVVSKKGEAKFFLL
jgi:phage-related minor tail protein